MVVADVVVRSIATVAVGAEVQTTNVKEDTYRD